MTSTQPKISRHDGTMSEKRQKRHQRGLQGPQTSEYQTQLRLTLLKNKKRQVYYFKGECFQMKTYNNHNLKLNEQT